jgi:hypothetical protein
VVLCGVVSSTLEVSESSNALAAGNRVAINSREEERPRMVIDFFLCEDLFISVLLSLSHHPRMLTRGFLPWLNSLK